MKKKDILADVSDFMGMNMRTEWTAWQMDDLSLMTIARWRYEGWPTQCVICGKELIIEKG